MNDTKFDEVLESKMSLYQKHVDAYYKSFKKLLKENNRNFYTHEFMFLLFDSVKFKDTLLKLEKIDVEYGGYNLERDFLWTGDRFVKCSLKNEFCKRILMSKQMGYFPNEVKKSNQDL